ncbi:MAG: Hydroxypyruvate reductase [Rhodospirillales bacterium]|nr:Hydroxypyruvate reductase [Rhodospirillales bacterium]
MTSTSVDPTQLLRAMFDAAVAAASPAICVPPHLPEPHKGRTIVIGAGKAAAAMARAVEDHWPGPVEGLVVTRYGHGALTDKIAVVEAGHPMPDEAGVEAAERIIGAVRGLTVDDLVLNLISGGGSALLSLPAPGVTLADKQVVNKALLRSGAPIVGINCVRKHLSAVKGGRLALAAHPARVISLIISDVPGDDPATVASGPTVPDATSLADARAILAKYGIAPPASVTAHLENPDNETPKPGDPLFAHVENIVIATAQASLQAAAEVARRAGVTPILLGDAVEGEARAVAAEQARMTLAQIPGAPCVLISGGETSVTVRGNGRGGRNAEFLLALAIALDGHANIHAIACDTDGIDGTEDNAGALLRPDSLERAHALGLNPRALLENNDGYGFFSALDDLVITGPTRTNVNDFRAILVMPIA